MPCAASFSALTASWVNRELPPSITRSPSASRPDSSSIDGGDDLDRHHDPDRARGRQRLDHLGQGGGVGDVLVAVVAGDLDAAAAQPLAHVVAHLAEADESDVHARSRG